MFALLGSMVSCLNFFRTCFARAILVAISIGAFLALEFALVATAIGKAY